MEENKVIKTTMSALVNDVCHIVEQGRRQAYIGVNAIAVMTYWKVGRRIVEEEQQGEKRAEYGKQLIEQLAQELTKELGSDYTARRLRDYRQFYLYFKDLEIWHSRVPNLTWTHYRHLLRVGDETARLWYAKEASKAGWSTRTLDRNIGSQYYYRLLQSPKKEAVVGEMMQKTASYETQKAGELIKSPIVAEFLGLSPNPDYTETKLEKAIISHLSKFLMELGRGFALVARQQHIATDAGDYYIDLVFYNYLLKSFVLIDLKTTKISHQDVGQMDMYIRMYDELKRTEGDNPTIGILLCAETSEDIARYSILRDSNQLFAAKYMTFMPTKEELQREIEREKELFLLQEGKTENDSDNLNKAVSETD